MPKPEKNPKKNTQLIETLAERYARVTGGRPPSPRTIGFLHETHLKLTPLSARFAAARGER